MREADGFITVVVAVGCQQAGFSWFRAAADDDEVMLAVCVYSPTVLST